MAVHFSTSKLDWDDARIFLAAYRSGSLLGAAQILGVSHSTVRRRLAGLEAALDARLFTATPEGLIPTDAAEKAFAAAERVETAMITFSEGVAGDARDLQGALVITTVDGLVYIIAPAISAYADKHPNVRITVNTDNRFFDLARREADLAVRLTNAPDETLFGRKIGVVAYAPYATRSLIKQCGKAFAELPWVLWDASAGATGTEQWVNKHAGGAAPAARVTNVTSMVSLARAGVGAALLPVPLAKSAGLVQLAEPVPGFDMDLWCLCHRDLRHSERVRAFMDQLAETGVML